MFVRTSLGREWPFVIYVHTQNSAMHEEPANSLYLAFCTASASRDHMREVYRAGGLDTTTPSHCARDELDFGVTIEYANKHSIHILSSDSLSVHDHFIILTCLLLNFRIYENCRLEVLWRCASEQESTSTDHLRSS
nr:hypothetical protein CFP56_11359 [Quercus suber]